jgi:hypothetical protein
MGRGKFQGKIIIHGDNIFEGQVGKCRFLRIWVVLNHL